MKSFIKLTEVSESCAEHSFCKIVDGVALSIGMLGHESQSGLSMSVTHTEENPILVIRVTDFLMYGLPKRISCGVVSGVNCPIVVVPNDTHCHTVNYDTFTYQITNSGECQRLLKEFWKLRDSQDVPNQEERSERFGRVLAEGLRRATRPWKVEVPDYVENACITHGEFKGLLNKADRIYQLNSVDFKEGSFENEYYADPDLQLWVLEDFSDSIYYVIEKWSTNPMYRFYNKGDIQRILEAWETKPTYKQSEFVDGEDPLDKFDDGTETIYIDTTIDSH